MVKLVASNQISNELLVPNEMGQPRSHHLLGTKCDNLIELSGRVCYDSLIQEKSRSSKDYHQHIIDVNHGSVQEHVNLVFRLRFSAMNQIRPTETALCCCNRPGVFVYFDEVLGTTIVANIRAIREWNNFYNTTESIKTQKQLGQTLQRLAQELCPFSLSGVDIDDTTFFYDGFYIDTPKEPHEYWYSFYLGDVSRGLTHELVRHKFQTAVSQRSTRYVDESESDWALHPLVQKYKDKINKSRDEVRNFDKHETPSIECFIYDSKSMYRTIVSVIETELIAEGVDKFTARKQARGAARGFLGNALSTELIFSGSLEQWKRIIKMRMSAHADAEIRLMAGEVYNILKNLHPEYFADLVLEDCPDGIGQGVR